MAEFVPALGWIAPFALLLRGRWLGDLGRPQIEVIEQTKDSCIMNATITAQSG